MPLAQFYKIINCLIDTCSRTGDRMRTLVVGSEIATGTVADDGTIKLSSNWKAGGSSYLGSYTGVLTEKSGTLTGAQAWTMPEGQQNRSCTIAVVRAETVPE